MFKRKIIAEIASRIREQRKFIQVLTGPRQTGKTTLARQVLEECALPSFYASADEPALKGIDWIGQQWENARAASVGNNGAPAVLVLDEIQKIPGWSETIKRCWDEDSLSKNNIKVILLGSSPLGIGTGLTESLAGRFEVISIGHWSYPEMRDAFDWGIQEYVIFGGYPGSAGLIGDVSRWKNYVKDSLVETGISRDILLMTRVDKPALLRRVFELGCHYSGQILSYQKMLGQLQDAGNTVTVAHYLDLLSRVGFMAGIQKFAGNHLRKKASSPKLMVMNNALMTSHSELSPDTIRNTPEIWGRWIESAVGGHLINSTRGTEIQVHYWNSGTREIDFVLSKGPKNIVLEVKSGLKTGRLPGIREFERQFDVSAKILIGKDGIPVEKFLSENPSVLFG